MPNPTLVNRRPDRRCSIGSGKPRESVAIGLVNWARRFILFHNKRHPSQFGPREVTHLLEHVVKTVPEPLPGLAQARSALALLYGSLLGIDLGELSESSTSMSERLH